MMKLKKYLSFVMIVFSLLLPYRQAKADLFGGDVVVLMQILVQAIEQVARLQNIIQNGNDTLNLLRDINSGARSGLDLIKIINPKFDVGVYGDLKNPQNVLNAIHDLYGKIPKTADQGLMETQDQSVAEVISMNRNLFDYADQVDQERERIMIHSQIVSPQGAAKLQNQSTAILIGVMTQLLRTQSQMLKIMGQNMALENRKEKLTSGQFIESYEGLSNGFKSLPQKIELPVIKGGE